VDTEDKDNLMEAEIVQPTEEKQEEEEIVDVSATSDEKSKEDQIPEYQERFTEEEQFTEAELDKYMSMSEDDLEKEIKKEANKEQKGGYEQTKQSLKDEMLKREQKLVDKIDRMEKEGTQEIKGNWTRNTDFNSELDRLIREKEEMEANSIAPDEKDAKK